MLVAQPQFALRADHPGGLDASYDRRRQLHRLARLAVGEDGADAGERDLLPCGHVRRAAHDRPRRVSRVHVCEPQAVGVRMRADVRHQPDDDVRPARSGAGVVGRLQPRDGEPAGQFVRARPQRNVLGEPRKRNSHAKRRCSVRWRWRIVYRSARPLGRTEGGPRPRCPRRGTCPCDRHLYSRRRALTAKRAPTPRSSPATEEAALPRWPASAPGEAAPLPRRLARPPPAAAQWTRSLRAPCRECGARRPPGRAR